MRNKKSDKKLHKKTVEKIIGTKYCNKKTNKNETSITYPKCL